MTLARRLGEALAREPAEALIPGDGLALRPADLDAVAAAVLIAVTDRAEPGVILTQRPETMRKHPGQVAFPGGRVDSGDDGVVAAALREAEEEIALPAGLVDVVGIADIYRTVTGYDVTPVVAVVPPDLPLHPNDDEVAAIFEAPLDWLLDTANHATRTVEFQGLERTYWEMHWGDFRIWGRDRGNDRQPVAAAAMAVTVADPPWAAREGMAALFAALEADGGTTRIVGGAVRDALAGQAVKDIDLATVLAPDAVVARLKDAKIKAVPTGLAHGTITAVLGSGPVEITTLRKDVATDGRRATIAYTDDWREDAGRRDFTINALYADAASGEVFDYFGGVDDLMAGRVRFIGDPLQRIAEDHLRILRFFRFHARFGKGAPDAAALSACAARANDLMALSRERIAMELLALLALPEPQDVVALMIAHGILAPVLPEIHDAGPLVRLTAREAAYGIAPDPLRRLAALLAPDLSVADDIAARLKLSNAARKRLAAAAARTAEDTRNPRALAYAVGMSSAIDRLLLGEGDVAAVAGWTPPRFALTGGGIVARGIEAGPEVARILKAVEAQWVAEGFPDAARVDAIADAITRG